MIAFVIVLLSFVFKSIDTRGPPTLLPNKPSLSTFEVYENSTVELNCPVVSSAAASIQWFKDKEDLEQRWFSSNLVIKGFLLKIRQVQIIDAGLYRCRVVNGFGSVEAQFQVNVKSINGTLLHDVNNEPDDIINADFDSFAGEAPEFVLRANDHQVGPTKVIQPEGTTAQLKCLASGRPTPTVRWKKNGKKVSEDEYGIIQSQILLVKDLRQSDAGNYTCELFNPYGSINATYILVVTEKIRFFGNDPQDITVEEGQDAELNCSIQTNDSATKIRWLKRKDSEASSLVDATVFGSEPYEDIHKNNVRQSGIYLNTILSKSLHFSSIGLEDAGQYICLVQNDVDTNYRATTVQVTAAHKNSVFPTNINYNLFYLIAIPICLLGLIVCRTIFVRRRQQRRKTSHRKNLHLRSDDVLKSSIKSRQPLIHNNASAVPSTTTTRISHDHVSNNSYSIPVTRQYKQHPRDGLFFPSDHGSLTSSTLYYARA